VAVNGLIPLRQLGERDYLEFSITGKNKPQKVGNVTVELKGVNQKRNQYSVAMTVEDKRFEKKNRALNEPILFYTSGMHQPEEVVINKVGKDQVSGYVSIPKANGQSTGSATNSGRYTQTTKRSYTLWAFSMILAAYYFCTCLSISKSILLSYGRWQVRVDKHKRV
jgi:hypothetical protein